MALQVKRKNIGQAPTRSNPYLNKKNLPYQKGIIMEEGGPMKPPTLAEISKIKDKNRYEPSQTVKSIKSVLASASAVPNPLISLPASGLSAIADASTAFNYYMDNNKEKAIEDLLQAGVSLLPGTKTMMGMKGAYKASRPLVKGTKLASDIKTVGDNSQINPYAKMVKSDNPNKQISLDKDGNEIASTERFPEIDKMRNPNWVKNEEPNIPKTIPNPDYTDKGNRWLNMRDKKKPGFDDMKPGVQKAIGGMFNPFKEKIVPQETSTENDDYSYEDDMDDIEDDYQSQLSEKDIEMDEKQKEINELSDRQLENNKLIKELSLSRYYEQQEALAQSIVNMETNKDFNRNNSDLSKSGIGRYGQEIMSELTSSLGYKPSANSIFRTPEKQEELIKQGFGVKNSFHLTGDAVDLKPEDWNKIPDMVKSKMKGKYDIVSHNNHVHIEPKTRFQVGGVYEGIDYKGLEELKKLGYKFEIL